MDQKLHPQQFKSVVEAAYPTYLMKLSQTCFSKCCHEDAAKFEEMEPNSYDLLKNNNFLDEDQALCVD